MSMPAWVDAAVQGVAALGGVGGVVAAVLYRHQRRQLAAQTDRARVDAAQVLTNAALTLLDPYRQQIRDLEQDLREAREQAHILSGQLTTALAELQDLRNQVSIMTKELDARDHDQQARR